MKKYIKHIIGVPVALLMFNIGLLQLIFAKNGLGALLGLWMTVIGGHMVYSVLSSLKETIQSK